MHRLPSGAGHIELVQGDITLERTDAIVNAANTALTRGGGVDAAIHRAAGAGLQDELYQRYPQGCPTGQAVSTSGGQLQARWIIHAVAPVYHDGQRGEPAALASAYRNALKQAADLGAATVAIPSLGTGIYGNPLAASATLAIAAAVDHLAGGRPPFTVRFVLYDRQTMAAFVTALDHHRLAHPD